MAKAHMAMFLVKAFSTAIIFVTTVFSSFVFGPAMETRLYPVVGKLRIIYHEQLSATQTKIRFSYWKYRECDLQSVVWNRVNGDGDQERVSYTIEQDPSDTVVVTHSVGRNVSRMWTVNMPWDELEAQSHVIAYHKCWPFWTTRSDYYP